MSDAENAHCFSTLAPELIDHILFDIDSVRDLGNLIIASRCLRWRFEGQKHAVIWRVLQNELGPVLTDAKFLRLFPYADPGSSYRKCMAYWDGIHNMAAVYRDMLRGGRADATAPRLAELNQLCRTLHYMNFLASTYLTSQLRSFRGEVVVMAPPSRAERLRDTAAVGNTSEHRGERLALFAAFEPWELQQVDHADWFVTRLCSALCLAGEEVAQPMGEAASGNIFSHVDQLVQYMREHPGITNTVLRTLLSPPRRRSRGVPGATPVWRQHVERYSLICLSFAWQTDRLRSFPDPARDQHGEQQQQEEEEEEEDGSRASVNFVGEAVDLPPFGWVDALNGRYVNWFGNALVDSMFQTSVPDDKDMYFARHRSLELWRGAGFALWDQRRVKVIKELDRLKTLHTGWLAY